MSWQIPQMWEGGDVWIIGGGPSVTKQFGIPEKIVQNVLKGILTPAAYSPYFAPIHNKHVIGVNAAYLLGDWMDIIFFGDNGFFLQHKNALAAHPAIKVTCWPTLNNKYDWLRWVGRDTTKTQGITSNPLKVSWNGNSGAAAISLAAHAGAKRILLLGFDMALDQTRGNQHWHNTYGTSERGKMNAKRLPFDRHLRGFPRIAEDAKKLGITILNVSPESAIECFQKVSLKQVLTP